MYLDEGLTFHVFMVKVQNLPLPLSGHDASFSACAVAREKLALNLALVHRVQANTVPLGAALTQLKRSSQRAQRTHVQYMCAHERCQQAAS